MDLTNQVKNLEKFQMIDPTDENSALSLSLARQTLKGNDVQSTIYPRYVFEPLLAGTDNPRCIFIPEKKLLRKMIRSLVQKDEQESSAAFLLRFGLIDNPHKYI